MNAPLDSAAVTSHQLAEAIAQACDRIAPTWPLDQFIAVNPYWGWVSQSIESSAARLGVLGGTALTPPRAWMRAQWQSRELRREHLEAVAQRHGLGEAGVAGLMEALEHDVPLPKRLPLVSDLCDAGAPTAGWRWSELAVQQISQHCAAYFDDGQARWRLGHDGGLHGSWKRQVGADHGLPWPHAAVVRAELAAWPEDPVLAIGRGLATLGIPQAGRGAYLTALLLNINGWAAWCAYERWQARLAGRQDDHLVHLLAVRLGWEVLLRQACVPRGCDAHWREQWAAWEARAARLAEAQRHDWMLLEACELAYQAPLCHALATQPAAAQGEAAPWAQAVFCIDVRSEVLRRALEAECAGVQTRGFAGFFGLPIAYQPIGSDFTRPQVPGLLAPAMTVTEPVAGDDGAPLAEAVRRQRRGALGWRQRWADLRASAASGFSFVEACGLAYGAKLVADSLPAQRDAERWEDAGLPADRRGAPPQLALAQADPAAAATLARGILGAMGLPDRQAGLAPLVLLVGHGSQSANNPHAAGLDCGACGGQSGEVNARALAQLLNAVPVREALREQGVSIPPQTHFVAAVHNTTTDEVRLYDTGSVPAILRRSLERLRAGLEAAGGRARAERAPALGLGHLRSDPQALARAIRERANDWAQVRPEWGLANCASFIVAPRTRTRGLNLQGRSFLHDYDWRQDTDLRLLELIMTAPMVVTNWINLQYHASAVDPHRYGSGNKVLHNVVGARLGVFEGNAGDLRIGLPWQSVHDGRALRHAPLRLSVFIEAPSRAIDQVIERHAVVRDLVDRGWLRLLRIDPARSFVEQRRNGGWTRVAGALAGVDAAAPQALVEAAA